MEYKLQLRSINNLFKKYEKIYKDVFVVGFRRGIGTI